MADSETLNADTVALFLQDNPEFFHLRDDLLLSLTVPHDSGEAVSLVERQVGVLRERNIELRQRLNNLLDVARDNDSLFNKTRKMVLSQLETKSLNASITALKSSLEQDFECDTISLTLFSEQFDSSPIDRSRFPFVRFTHESETNQQLSSLTHANKIVCGNLRPDEIEILFPVHARQVQSAAIVPIQFKNNYGILAIGSFNADHFHSSMGTLFLSHIADVLSRTFNRLLSPQLTSLSA